MVRSLVVATALALATLLDPTSRAWARADAPLMPTAVVEDVKSATAEVEFMDYVGPGQVIALAAKDTLVLSYLRSCEHETITGGKVMVGMERSEIQGGQVVRSKVPCDGGKIDLTAQQASVSGASAFRLQSADIRPTLYARSPVVQLPKDLSGGPQALLIERVGRKQDRREVKIDAGAGTPFHDLAKDNIRLARGAVYKASLGGHTMTFKIDAKAKSGSAPVVSRLLRFP